MRGPLQRRVRRLFLFVLLAAAVHAVAAALVRPMFQVTDEFAYFTRAQAVAVTLTTADAVASRRVLPDGRPFYDSPGGKPLFGRIGGQVLAAAARRHDSADAALLTRLAFAVSHVLVAAATWLLARRLYPSRLEIAFVASLLVAWQPVLTIFDAGITPDAWANAAGAWSLCLIGLALTTRAPMASMVAAAAFAALAFAFKDTAICLLVSVLVALPVAVWRARGRLVSSLVGVAGLAGLAVVLANPALRSPYWNELAATTLTTPVSADTVWRVATIATAAAPRVFQSFWTAYGNFDANEPIASSTWDGTFVVLCLGAFVAWMLRRPPLERPPAAAWLAVFAGLAAGVLLHPLRVVLLQNPDTFQGRWLFPVAAPLMIALAVGMRAAVRDARAAAAFGALVAGGMGILPLLFVVVPFYYETFPDLLNRANLFLRGAHGGDAAHAMIFVAPTSEWITTGRAVALVAASLVAVAGVVIGIRWIVDHDTPDSLGQPAD